MKIMTSSLFAVLVVFFSFGRVNAVEKPTVFVSILPQKYFVEQVARDIVNVEVMVQPGASPATYEPKASQMKKLAGSLAYYAIGVPFENAWLDKIASINPEMKVIHTDRGIAKLEMKEHRHEEKQHDDHNHKHEEDHDAHLDKGTHHQHDGLDPHIWLAPSLVKQQADVIAETLIDFLPEHASLLEKNLKIFKKKIDDLDNELHLILKDMTGMKFMVFHPSWGYFANEYGLEQVAIEIEGKDPKPAQLASLIKSAQDQDIHVIFVQPQFSQKSAQVIAREIKGEVITIDPLAEDWSTNMRVVAEKFKRALR
ncbi:MAG: zinc ABC transporter substrate-binding protein [Desulfopila sp.]|jgi:zinc transport system substrate-binding protein|nr:zinc ABC transporter substrate-binding protein [Desulfopila sp.]